MTQTRFGLALLAGLLLTPATFANEAQASPANEVATSDAKVSSASSGRRIAGSYYLEVLHEGFPPAAALVTLTRDGRRNPSLANCERSVRTTSATRLRSSGRSASRLSA